MKKSNMYKLSVKQWNPFVGCNFNCVYCRSSFQAQLKRWAGSKKGCKQCYDYDPHFHPERLNQYLPKTGYMQFIFTCSSGDIAFCPSEYFLEMLERIQAEPDKIFLIQSKNPKTFNRMWSFPTNLVLGTTIETNRDELYEGISKAPEPSKRYEDFLKIKHPLKMVSVEPVIDFDVDVMVTWIREINPCMVWLGYDSKKNYLPEPEFERVKALHWELSKRGFIVILKTLRKAWWE